MLSRLHLGFRVLGQSCITAGKAPAKRFLLSSAVCAKPLCPTQSTPLHRMHVCYCRPALAANQLGTTLGMIRPAWACLGLRHMSGRVERKEEDKDDHPRPLDTPRLTPRQRLKMLVKDYGQVTLAVYFAYDFLTLSVLYFLIDAGVDVSAVLAKIGLSNSKWLTPGAGTLVAAFAANKLTSPLRVLLTVATTPYTIKALQQRNILKATPAPTMKEMRKEYHGVKSNLENVVKRRKSQASTAVTSYRRRLDTWRRGKKRRGRR